MGNGTGNSNSNDHEHSNYSNSGHNVKIDDPNGGYSDDSN